MVNVKKTLKDKIIKKAVTYAKDKNKRRRKRKYSFAYYINNVMNQGNPFLSISSKAMKILDNFVMDIFERIATEASKIARYNNKPTISCRELQTAVVFILPGGLAKHAVAEGVKAVTKYMMSKMPPIQYVMRKK